MEKTALGLVAALGAAAVAPTAANASTAAADRILNPTSVAELLDPVADPVATLNDLQQRQLEGVEAPDTQVAELVVVQHRRYYRHHHHHHFYRRFYHHHHHHWHHHHWRRHYRY